jgi:hypothetical protein
MAESLMREAGEDEGSNEQNAWRAWMGLRGSQAGGRCGLDLIMLEDGVGRSEKESRLPMTKWTVVIVDAEEHVDEEVVHPSERATTFTASSS